jgi:hypothetical protein
VTLPQVLTQLDQAIDQATAEEHCILLGALVEREERLRLKLRTVTAAGTVTATEPDVNIPVEEAAQRLGVSTDYLYRNRLPFKVRIGRRVLCSVRGLERWNRQRQERS